MKRLLSKSLLVLMVSALIATSINNAFAQRGDRPMRDSARIEREIPNLTAEQKTKIQALRVVHQKEVTPLKNELAEKKAHLKTLESAEKTDKDAINKTIDEISSLQAKIMKSNASHRIEVASNLTDEQKVFFNAHREKRGDGQRGKGMGTGRGDGMGNGMGKGHKGNNPNK